MSELLDAALGYAERGWSVFSLKPRSKVPRTKHGLKDATLDPDQIRGWWARWPRSNIGVRTGLVFDVLDVDGDEGQASLDGFLHERHR